MISLDKENLNMDDYLSLALAINDGVSTRSVLPLQFREKLAEYARPHCIWP